MEKFYKKWFLLLSAPAVILFLFIILIPFLMGVAYSFTGWRGTYFVGGDTWWQALVGFDNYKRIFTSRQFIDAFTYTVTYTVVALATINVVALGMALMIKRIRFGKSLFAPSISFPTCWGGLP
ncbi:hypothetical protein [Anaerotalea alkaliphila]|uniref:hypothetical protein n=1 Tax=Anaerotalea alkaliphila TaxID=2662126 RepID=UPI001FE88F4B|nr:hypothetical protein [Anaerotalea alkaliphila]